MPNRVALRGIAQYKYRHPYQPALVSREVTCRKLPLDLSGGSELRAGCASLHRCKWREWQSRYSAPNNWWTRQDSNLRPAVCKTDALPAELRVRNLQVYQDYPSVDVGGDTSVRFAMARTQDAIWERPAGMSAVGGLVSRIGPLDVHGCTYQRKNRANKQIGDDSDRLVVARLQVPRHYRRHPLALGTHLRGASQKISACSIANTKGVLR